MSDQYDQKQYPLIVSRTLNPSMKALATVVARHDAEITDADINLIQDLQDLKRSQILQDKSCVSGCLTYAPLQYNTAIANTFFIPTFDVLWNNIEILTIAGNMSPDLTQNRVQIPTPQNWTPGVNAQDAQIYVVFLEIWYQALNPVTGQGYYQDPITGLNYFYPYGGVNPDPSNAEIVPDDSIDPFEGLFTTERAQIQWRINVQPVALTYNFQTYQFGLDPDTTDASPYGVPLNVYAQAGQPAPIAASQYQFYNMGNVNGDTGLWRAGSPPWNSITTYNQGDVVTYSGYTYSSTQGSNLNNIPSSNSSWVVTSTGNVNNSLGTMDGYSYAMPLAVIFQRNTGIFDVNSNIFGCASATTPNSGVLANPVSGRFDSRLADQIFSDNVVDTRITNTLDAWDGELLLGNGFGDLVQGKTQLALSRGLSSGNKAEDLGSTLPYYVSIGTTPSGGTIPNTFPAGLFDGFMNGFSSDARTYESTYQITTSQKSTGISGNNWVLGDSFTITLPSTSQATITDISVTALVTQGTTKVPAALLQGQITITGLGSSSATVTFTTNLTGTLFDPGSNNLYATISTTYAAGTNVNLQQIPFTVDGGSIFDAQAGATMPVFGISEYDVQVPQVVLAPSNPVYQTGGASFGVSANSVYAISPKYSDIVLGTKIWLAVPGSLGTSQTIGGNSVTTFMLPMTGISGQLNGLYCTSAWDLASDAPYTISSCVMTSTTPAGIMLVVQLQASVSPSSTIIFSILAQNTVQTTYNAPVKGITSIEETVMFGNYQLNQNASQNFPCDTRVVVENVSQPGGSGTPTTIVLGANGCTIKGISGNDVSSLIWVADNSGNLNSLPITSINFVNDVVVVVVPGTVNLVGNSAQPFLFCGSILPALSATSTFIVEIRYIPYQGEGVINRDYEILASEDNALVTSNGTGSAPIIGLTDVYPYNRELPIITTLPAQSSWGDAGLTNTPLASVFDSNYVAMRADNVETTFLVPLHTNDFIPPINKDTRKTIRFITPGQRGFATATPHIGFAITAPTPRTVLGQNLQNTTAPITLYVDNSGAGNDNNSGLTALEAKATFAGAMAELPPVLSFPCVIIFNSTGVPYSISALQSSLQTVALGDGDIRSQKQYCLGNLSRTIQGEGRLVISQAPLASSPVIITASGFAGFGDGPTAAFYIDTSRVILNGIQFVGFTNPAIVAYNADIDMVGCSWIGNAQAGSYIGCDSVILDGGYTSLADNTTGHVCVQSNLTSSNHNLIVSGPSVPPEPGIFYVGTRGSTVNLQVHAAGSSSQTDENWTVPTPTFIVVEAQLNSSVAVSSTFQTNGSAVLQANSVLQQTAVTNSFLGGVVVDASSSVVTQV